MPMTTRERYDALSEEVEGMLKAAEADPGDRGLIAVLNAKSSELMKLRDRIRSNAEANGRGPDLAKAYLGDAGAPADGTPAPADARPLESWAHAAADSWKDAAEDVGVKALLSGSIDIPTMVGPDPTYLPRRADRLIDLIVDREQVEGNEFQFVRQTVRTNNATPVADQTTKPTSVFTIQPVSDRLRVVAHLSQPVPERLFEDHRSLIRFLESEMGNGVMDALEDQVTAGDGTGEEFTGILEAAGTTAVSFDTDALTTVRKARTAMQVLHETPTAWVMSPADAEAFDLIREGTSGGFLLNGASVVFGDVRRIVSTSVPEGTAILADWRQARLFYRSAIRIDADRSGEHFEKNEVVVRAEGRFGLGLLRPQAFAIVELVDPGA